MSVRPLTDAEVAVIQTFEDEINTKIKRIAYVSIIDKDAAQLGRELADFTRFVFVLGRDFGGTDVREVEVPPQYGIS